MLLIRRHDELTSVYLVHAAVHFDDLHEAWPLKTLALLILLHFSKDGRVLRKVIVDVH